MSNLKTKTMTDIYFPVRKVPVEEIAPGFEHPSGLSHAIVVTKPDGTERVVQYCSEIYFLVPNDTIIPQFEKELSRFFKVETVYRMDRWARFFIDFILTEKSMAMSPGDMVFPRIRLINSYDGSIRYHFMAGFWRKICANGLMGYVWEKAIKAMHTPKLGKETSFGAVMEMTSEFLAESSSVFEVYQELQDNRVDDWEMRIEEIVEETSFPISLQEHVTDRMGEELGMLPGMEPNDWLIYNAFNYQLNHNEELKAKSSKKDVMDQDVLQYLLKY